MKNILFFFALLLAGNTGTAQTPANDLDFWLGAWDLRWQDTDSTQATGTNQITRELDGKVICENFLAQSGQTAGFAGRSWSVFDQRAQTWKQTWVDSQGSYLDFTGGREGDTFVFRRRLTGKDGALIQQKMVFHDIQPDQFVWDWMRSDTDGQTWQLQWRIYYTRRKS